jgi:hypothetical protein
MASKSYGDPCSGRYRTNVATLRLAADGRLTSTVGTLGAAHAEAPTPATVRT